MSGWAFYKNISAEPAYVGAKTANKKPLDFDNQAVFNWSE